MQGLCRFKFAVTVAGMSSPAANGAPAGGAGAQALPHATARNNAQLFTAAAERVTRLFKSPDRNHFCLAANAVTALYREQEAEVARAQHRG